MTPRKPLPEAHRIAALSTDRERTMFVIRCECGWVAWRATQHDAQAAQARHASASVKAAARKAARHV